MTVSKVPICRPFRDMFHCTIIISDSFQSPYASFIARLHCTIVLYMGQLSRPQYILYRDSLTDSQSIDLCSNYCCLVSSFGLLVSFQLVIGILQHFSIVLVSYKSLVFLLV